MDEPIADDLSDVLDVVARAESARDRADWDEAEQLYGIALQRDPTLYGHSVQRGHALRQLGRHAESEAAYRHAAEGEPFVADAFLHLGHALRKLNRNEEALDCFARTLALDPSSESARIELVNSGRRDRLPAEMFGRTAWRDEIAYTLRNTHETVDAVRSWVGVLAYPLGAWDTFRNTFPIRPPSLPRTCDDEILVLVDARGMRPSQLRATLLSLQDQTYQRWKCRIWADEPLSRHPVGSFAFLDDRIGFAELGSVEAADRQTHWNLLIAAGGMLHPFAIEWLLHTALSTDAVGAYCDEDIGILRRIAGVYHTAPAFNEVFDVDAVLNDGPLPSCVMFDSAALEDLCAGMGSQADVVRLRRALILKAASRGAVVHAPRVLYTHLVPEADAAARDVAAPADRDQAVPLLFEPDAASSVGQIVKAMRQPPGTGIITIVIPTLDQAEMLATCIDSLIGKAANPALLDIIVVDNRSREDATFKLFADIEVRNIARVVPMDEPFNWSRANNIAADISTGEHLLFLNNDTQMITQNWDDRLRVLLARDDIGAIGAKLLYPDLTVQHGGVLLGVDRQGPVHEGISAARVDPGPLGRWTKTRAAAAVTGAFLAVRRSVFQALCGFDERNFFLVYNDIDFCLRVREAGLKVLFDAQIEMIHYESKTRGRTVQRDSIEWDAAELATLHRRWGDAVEKDPSYNPYWSLWSVPFDGYREPLDSEIKRYIMLQAKGNPWLATRRGA